LKGSPLLAAALLAMFLAPACGPGKAASGTAAMSSADKPAATEILARRDLDVPLDKERATVTVDLPALPEGKRLGLYLDGVDLGRGGYYEVYANLPPGTEPRPEGPHYLGTLSSFGPKGGAARVGYDVTRLMGALRAEGSWNGKMALTFVRRGLLPPPGKAAPPPKGAGRITRVTVVRE
jgi:hypothetical protein